MTQPTGSGRPDPVPGAPLDPDLGTLRGSGDVLLAIAAGGAIGSLGRWAVAEALPHDPGRMPWSTVAVNLTGSLLLGVLMALMLGPWRHTRLVRPLLGVGLLGGWTTFSTAMLDLRDLIAADRPAVAFGYLSLSLAGGVIAAWAGLIGTRGFTARDGPEASAGGAG